MVNSLIDSLCSDSALRQGLQNELSAIYSSTAVADTAGKPNIARKVWNTYLHSPLTTWTTLPSRSGYTTAMCGVWTEWDALKAWLIERAEHIKEIY